MNGGYLTRLHWPCWWSKWGTWRWRYSLRCRLKWWCWLPWRTWWSRKSRATWNRMHKWSPNRCCHWWRTNRWWRTLWCIDCRRKTRPTGEVVLHKCWRAIIQRTTLSTWWRHAWAANRRGKGCTWTCTKWRSNWTTGQTWGENSARRWSISRLARNPNTRGRWPRY